VKRRDALGEGIVCMRMTSDQYERRCRGRRCFSREKELKKNRMKNVEKYNKGGR
jgi:hypothetical protein